MNMKTPNKADELKYNLFFLKLYYEKALEILESIKGPSLIKIGWTKSLNETYCEFVGEIGKILKMPEFRELKKPSHHKAHPSCFFFISRAVQAMEHN